MFEQQYGDHHPFFYGCRFADALRNARREGKLVIVYLHDPDHPYTEPFCRRTLCSDVVVEFLDANFVSWGAVTESGEGPGMVASLQPGSFPFCAVVAPVSDESIAVLQQVYTCKLKLLCICTKHCDTPYTICRAGRGASVTVRAGGDLAARH